MKLSRTKPAKLFPAMTLLVLGTGILPLGCKKDAGEAKPNERGDTANAADRYTVEGMVRAVPPPAEAGRTLTILHQAIPDFRNREGRVVGMMSMPMPFLVPESVKMDGLKPGDKVRFTFTVDWKSKIPTHIVALDRLPEDHEIDFAGGASGEPAAADQGSEDSEETAADQGERGEHDEHDEHDEHGTAGASGDAPAD